MNECKDDDCSWKVAHDLIKSEYIKIKKKLKEIEKILVK